MKLSSYCDLDAYPIPGSDGRCLIVSNVQPEYSGVLIDAWVELSKDLPIVETGAGYSLSYEMTHELPSEFAPDVSSFMSKLFRSATIRWHN